MHTNKQTQMDISSLLKDNSRLQLNADISALIDDKKLEQIDGRRQLPLILRNSELTPSEKSVIIKRKRRINQQNALKAFREREREANRRLLREISDKQQQKTSLQAEKQRLLNEINNYRGIYI